MVEGLDGIAAPLVRHSERSIERNSFRSHKFEPDNVAARKGPWRDTAAPLPLCTARTRPGGSRTAARRRNDHYDGALEIPTGADLGLACRATRARCCSIVHREEDFILTANIRLGPVFRVVLPSRITCYGTTTLGHERSPRSGLGGRRQMGRSRCVALSASRGGFYLDTDETAGSRIAGERPADPCAVILARVIARAHSSLPDRPNRLAGWLEETG